MPKAQDVTLDGSRDNSQELREWQITSQLAPESPVGGIERRFGGLDQIHDQTLEPAHGAPNLGWGRNVSRSIWPFGP